MIYLKLFFSFFKIGLFAIGGAYSFLPLIEREVVERWQWLTKSEFLEVGGFVKIFPGAISIKYATYTGYKVGGVFGVIIANLANMLAPLICIIIVSILYLKYKEIPRVKSVFSMIQLVIFAMIISVAFKTISINQLSNVFSLVVIILAFSLFIYTKIDPALIIIAAGILGYFIRS